VSYDSFYVNQREMLESILRVSEGKLGDWTITKEPVQTYYQKAMKDLQAGNRMAFPKVMYSRCFFPGPSIRVRRMGGIMGR